MKKILFLSVIAGCGYANASVLSADVPVSFLVARSCNIANLPGIVKLSVANSFGADFKSFFKVICNDDQPVSLVITQLNQSGDGNSNLVSNDSAHRVLYNLFINDVRYNNTPLSIQPNIDNSIRIHVNPAINTGQYQDSLIFTINY